LFYYRRYVQLAGEKARESAKIRVATLEMTAGAKEAAEGVSRSLGVETLPVATPQPKVEQSVEKITPDGVRVRVDSPEDVVSEKIDPKKIVRPSKAAVPIQIPYREALPGQASEPPGENLPVSKPGDDSPEQPGDAAPQTPKSVFTPPPVTQQLEADPENREAAAPDPSPAAAPKPGTRTDAIQKTHGTPAVTVMDQEEEQPEPTPAPGRNRGQRISVEVMGTPAAGQRGKVAGELPPAPRKPAGLNGVAAQFFTLTPNSGGSSVLKFSNAIPASVVTLVAVPADGSDPVNSILPTGENRTLRINPGTYEFRVSAANTNYPPATLFEIRFTCQIQQGFAYAHRFLPEDSELPRRD
jgi:hypothetical protein